MKRIKPLFQRRHYEVVAKLLRAAEPAADPRPPWSHDLALDRWAIIVDAFTDLFAADNPCFKRDMFLLATSKSTYKGEKWERSYALKAAAE
jgi:hypothetical protein